MANASAQPGLSVPRIPIPPASPPPPPREGTAAISPAPPPGEVTAAISPLQTSPGNPGLSPSLRTTEHPISPSSVVLKKLASAVGVLGRLLESRAPQDFYDPRRPY